MCCINQLINQLTYILTAYVLAGWLLFSLDEHAGYGCESAGPPCGHQVHPAVRDGILPGVQ